MSEIQSWLDEGGASRPADASADAGDLGNSSTENPSDLVSDVPADPDTPPQPLAVVLKSITISPSNPAPISISNGDTPGFIATGTYSDGHTENLTLSVTWEPKPPGIVGITTSGIAVGLDPGKAKITATEPATKKSDSVQVTVVP